MEITIPQLYRGKTMAHRYSRSKYRRRLLAAAAATAAAAVVVFTGWWNWTPSPPDPAQVIEAAGSYYTVGTSFVDIGEIDVVVR